MPILGLELAERKLADHPGLALRVDDDPLAGMSEDSAPRSS